MTCDIYRFVVAAKPSKNHSAYFEWQTVDAVVFVAGYIGENAKSRAVAFLKNHHLRILEFTLQDRLIEDRIFKSDNKELRQKYEEAKEVGISLAYQRVREFFADKQHPPLLFPKLTESFFDRVFQRMDGIRFPTGLVENQSKKTADYLVENYVVELKFLLKDPFETNTTRISQLFTAYPEVGAIDPSSLPDQHMSVFRDIIMKPLRTHVQKASKQIKGVREYLKKPELKSAILVVNQAATALMGRTHELLGHAVKRHTHAIDTVMSIELVQRSNGMDSQIDTCFEPSQAEDPIIRKTQNAFDEELGLMMDAFAHDGFKTDDPIALCFSKPINENLGIYAKYDELDNPYLPE